MCVINVRRIHCMISVVLSTQNQCTRMHSRFLTVLSLNRMCQKDIRHMQIKWFCNIFVFQGAYEMPREFI